MVLENRRRIVFMPQASRFPLGLRAASRFFSAPKLTVGNPASPIIYNDRQSLDCATFAARVETQTPRYGAQVAFEYNDFPLPKPDSARNPALVDCDVEKMSRAWKNAAVPLEKATMGGKR